MFKQKSFQPAEKKGTVKSFSGIGGLILSEAVSRRVKWNLKSCFIQHQHRSLQLPSTFMWRRYKEHVCNISYHVGLDRESYPWNLFFKRHTVDNCEYIHVTSCFSWLSMYRKQFWTQNLNFKLIMVLHFSVVSLYIQHNNYVVLNK